MNRQIYKSKHTTSGKAAGADTRLDDSQNIGRWMNFLILLLTGNMGIIHRWRLRYFNTALKERAQFLTQTNTKLVVISGFVILGIALKEHSALVLGLLTCLAPLLVATHSAIKRSDFLTTKALRAQQLSAPWMPWIFLCASAPTVFLPFHLPPPRATY